MECYREMIKMFEQTLIKTNIDESIIKAEIKALEPFADRTQSEIYKMFDTGAFNDILKAYCKVALVESGINTSDIDTVLQILNYLLETITSGEIVK